MTEEINVTSRRHIQTFRETITPRKGHDVVEIVKSLLEIAKTRKVNGAIVVNLHQGGVRNLVADSTEEVASK